MTALAEVGGQSARRFRGLWLALALSLTLNVCFVGGLIWAMMRPHWVPPVERLVQIGRSLNLDAGQRAALHEFGTSARGAARSLHGSNAPLMQQIWSEMAKRKADMAAISHLIETASQNRRDYQTAMAAALLKFLDTLPPEERRRYPAPH